VQEQHLASVIGSGSLKVLGTPALIGFMEKTAHVLAQTHLDNSLSSVGIAIEAKHLKPSLKGAKIMIKAFLIKKTEKILTFHLEAYDNQILVGTAEHERAIINVEKFKNKMGLV